MSQYIADFLRARYAEARKVEMSCRRALPDAPPCTMVRDSRESYVLIGYEGEHGRPRLSIEEFGERYMEPAPDPFTIADLDAKEALLGEHGNVNDGSCGTCVDGAWGYPTHGGGTPQRYPCRTLRLLTQPYAAHPDYTEAWKP